MPGRALPWLLMAAVALAGCGRPADPPEGPGFDGAAAMAFVEGLALQDDGSPRYRIPGSAGQAEGAAFLWEATGLPGWERTWQNLTGEDYLALDRSAVAAWGPGSGNCPDEDEVALPGLPFHNLVAVRDAGPGHPMLMLGAHWDSQMESNYDPDPAKRGLPDPGANDGASGVGVLLQLMREVDDRMPDLHVSIALFFIDGEDGFFNCYPLAGSLYFAAHPLVRPDAFILLDMVGDPGAKYPKETYGTQSAPRLQALVWDHGQALDGGLHFVNRSVTGRTVTITDDHVALGNAGIPSIDIIDAGRATTFPPQWDTSFDTVDLLDPAMLSLVGDVLLAVLGDERLPDVLADP